MSPSAPPPSPFSQPSERTILLVEDHPAQREVIRRWLIEENFRVEIASDFHRASKVLEHEVPILFCVDTTLPRESGLEFCEHIRKMPGLGPCPSCCFVIAAHPRIWRTPKRQGRTRS